MRLICTRCMIRGTPVKPREAVIVISGDALCGEDAVAALQQRRQEETQAALRRRVEQG